ncbi:unnamed protein product [Bursaphelenchus xylophilus]|uniref:(pine wood nematode) hypothetical protein n=1 Tax=Bursaphelenchus xylophilus TaxID=6326 RepID=A0A1I7RKZ4_BURXY|nr:unnamed protein product [Bursaphelenchus xylophilus]CAG9083676.1 unnamed protein product [Bursaphelenchus xylophilus]
MTVTDLKSVNVEEVDFLRRSGFSTSLLILNQDLGKVCAIRKCDDKNVDKQISFVEFYNILNLPAMYLEVQIPFVDIIVESGIWLGKKVLLGCNDGSVFLVSPFKTNMERHPLAVSSIISAARLSDTQAVLATGSGELKFIEIPEDGKIDLKKTVALNSDQRITSIAMSPKRPLLAIGLINSLMFFNIETNKQNIVHVPAQGNKNTVVWSLLFLDELLFSGDSRGKVTIYNANSFAVIKIIQTHETDVLSLCSDGEQVFASGVDHRIQVLKSTASVNVRSDWNTVGQRIIHKNDVNAMVAVGSWLISAGAEHKIYISNARFYIYFAKGKKWVSTDTRSLMAASLQSVELWRLHTSISDASLFGSTYVVRKDNGPTRLLRLLSPKGAVIYDFSVSPDFKHLTLFTQEGLLLYSINITKDNVKVERVFRVKPELAGDVTALTSTKTNVFVARGNAEIVKLNFKSKKIEKIAFADGAATISKLRSSEDGRYLVGTDTRCRGFYVDLKAKVDLDDAVVFIPCKDAIADLRFTGTKLVAFTPGAETKLRLFEIGSKKCKILKLSSIFEGINREICLGISSYSNDSVILHGSHGNVVILDNLCEKSQNLQLIQRCPNTLENEGDFEKLRFPVDAELFEGSEINGANSLIVCQNNSTSLPTRAPFRIKRYGRV